MSSEFPKSRRISLTKKQLQRESGEGLLNLLTEIVADGKVSDEEVGRLQECLKHLPESDLPSVSFLRDAIAVAIADGKLSESDCVDIHIAIERVLPVTDRAIAREARENASVTAEQLPKITREDLKCLKTELDPLERKPAQTRSWRFDPATKAQRDFIKVLGGTFLPSMTKGQASDQIEALLGNKPISTRQQMVMRFWSRERQPGEGPQEIAEWMDSLYAADPDFRKAWELYKEECEDNGLQGDPTRVPFGIGPKYLERIKRGGEAAVPRFRAKKDYPVSSYDITDGGSNRSYSLALVFVIVAAGVVGYFTLR